MAFSFYRIYLADISLDELNHQLENYKSRFWIKESGSLAWILQLLHLKPGLKPCIYSSLVSNIEEFEVEFGFLTSFLYFIHNWADANEVVQNSEAIVIKIQDVILEISKYLRIACARKYILVCPLKLIGVVSNFTEKIEMLKSEIRQAYRHLSSHSFQSISPSHAYFPWMTFVRSISENLHALCKKPSCTDAMQEEIETIADNLSRFIHFLGDVCDVNPKYMHQGTKIEDFLIHVGDVAIHAAHMSFLCWLTEIDRNIVKEINIIISDLLQKIDPTTPEFLEVNLRFLKVMNEINSSRSERQLDLLVTYLLGGIKQGVLHEELKFLVSTVINKSGLSRVDVQFVLADIKAAVREMRILECMSGSNIRTDLVLFKLLAKVWLIRAEVFLMEQLNGCPMSTSSASYQIEAVDDRLSFLRSCLEDSAEEDVENCKEILTFLEAVNKAVTSLYRSFQVKEITESRAIDVLLKLLLKIFLFKAESLVTGLLNDNAGMMILVKDRIKALHVEVKFLTTLVTDQPEEKTESQNPVFTQIAAVAKGVVSLCYSVPHNKITEDMISKMNLLLSELFDDIELVKGELKQIYLEVPRCDFPKTNALGYFDILLRKLQETLKYKPDSIASVKHQFETILGDLEFFKSFLVDIVGQEIECQELIDLSTCVIDVAYVAEYIIDLIVVGNGCTWYDMSRLYYLLEESRLVKIQITEVYEKRIYDVRFHNVAQASRRVNFQASTSSIDEVVMDLNDQEEVIIDHLIGGSLPRDIVSIVGMPGIGKTTMAKKVYNHPKLTYHFHIRAWCFVSQVYRKRDLLIDILSNIVGLTSRILQMTDEDLDLELYQKLKQQRYLIVMDDMWNIEAWDNLERSLPNDRNGSRILITSRLYDVALKAKPDSKLHPLRLLSDEESWNLLQRKTFHKEGCPEELLKIGKEIAKGCKGLPLAVVAISGLLERTNKAKGWWKQIVKSLCSTVVEDPQVQCRDILEMSYNHLPDHLRACFLYFGAFMEDRDIPVRRLISLWIAEGFIEKTELKSLEDQAEDYLRDLIGRSLVMVTKQRSQGGVKACRIHDILRDLCLSKSKEENFSQLITLSEEPHTSSDGLDYGVDLDCSSNSTTYQDYRLWIHSKRKQFVMSRPSGRRVRSLQFFASGDMYPRCPYDISFIPQNFKLLRVLDLEYINMGTSFLWGIELLVQLRYLSVSGDIDSVPSSISNLWNLETLVVKGLKGKVVLPDTIWFMTSLRHVHVSNYAAFSLQDNRVEKYPQLDNLVTLSSPSLSCGEVAEMIIRRLPNLRKLRCMFSQNCICFPRLDLLAQLEALKMSYYGKAPNFSALNLPLNLKKLTLSNFRFSWDHISAIGRLPNLEVLKLLSRAFEGKVWEMTEGQFLKLKFLKVDNPNLVTWNASNDDLPNLRHLVLQSCKQLKEVPPAILENPTLQVIELLWCGNCVDELVTRIEEEGIEGVKVFITR